MSKKVKESQRSVSTATPKIKEAIRPSARMKFTYDSRTGFVTRQPE